MTLSPPSSHLSAVSPAKRVTAESEETSCPTKKPRRRRGFVLNRKFLSWKGAPIRIFSFLNPNRSPAQRVRFGKEEQGSGRMTFFCSAGIKERRSKADFAPTCQVASIRIFCLGILAPQRLANFRQKILAIFLRYY